MATYVLVHGAWHGAWCWHKVLPLIEERGHKVHAIDLPGHGNDKTPTASVSLESYVQRVRLVLDGEAEPDMVVVGHSMGGIVITQAAEERPDRIRKLVYLCAFLPTNGQSLLDLGRQDAQTMVRMPNTVVPSADGTSLTLKTESLTEIFYHDCSDEDVTFARERLVPQAAAPFATAMHTTEANFGRVPRVYIECLQDHAISPSIQERMYTTLPCERVITMDTSHSPFFSAPNELAEHLLSLA
jgi:pimeloyl-ACP methyl ester carboxylesterase